MPGIGKLLSDTDWTPNRRRTGLRTASSLTLITEIRAGVATHVAFRQRWAHAEAACLVSKMRERTEKRPILAFAGDFAEILFELVFFVLESVGVSRGLALAGDVRPIAGQATVELQPLLQTLFRIGQDRVGPALRFTHAAVDAFVGIDDKHVIALVEAIHWADFNAVHVLALDASLGHDIGHQRLPKRAGACLTRSSDPRKAAESRTVDFVIQ